MTAGRPPVQVARERAFLEAAQLVARWRVSERARLKVDAHDSLRDLESELLRLAGQTGKEKPPDRSGG